MQKHVQAASPKLYAIWYLDLLEKCTKENIGGTHYNLC